MRKKTKDWKNMIFSLDVEIAQKIKEFSEFENMSKTQFIEFLILNWDKGINPNEKLNGLLERRKTLNLAITELDQDIQKQTEYIKYYSEIQKQKSIKKSQAIKILKRKILDQDFEEAERLSKIWSRMTGIPAMELIIETNNQIKKSGV